MVPQSKTATATKQPATMQPKIRIVEQPAPKEFRFRYECEGRSVGSIPGVNSTPENNTYPAIRIDNFIGEATIIVSCVTKDAPYRVHPYHLVGRGCNKGVCIMRATVIETDKEYQFKNLGIQCVKRKDIISELEKRAEMRVDPFRHGFDHARNWQTIKLPAVRLAFQVFYEDDKSGKVMMMKPAVSSVIYDKKTPNLRILHTIVGCSDRGSNQICLLCDKVTSEDTAIMIYERNERGEVLWQTCVRNFLVYKKVAAVFEMPPYNPENKDGRHRDQINLTIQLQKISGNERSNCVYFEYIPQVQGAHKKRKTINPVLMESDANILMPSGSPPQPPPPLPRPQGSIYPSSLSIPSTSTTQVFQEVADKASLDSIQDSFQGQFIAATSEWDAQSQHLEGRGGHCGSSTHWSELSKHSTTPSDRATPQLGLTPNACSSKLGVEASTTPLFEVSPDGQVVYLQGGHGVSYAPRSERSVDTTPSGGEVSPKVGENLHAFSSQLGVEAAATPLFEESPEGQVPHLPDDYGVSYAPRSEFSEDTKSTVCGVTFKLGVTTGAFSSQLGLETVATSSFEVLPDAQVLQLPDDYGVSYARGMEVSVHSTSSGSGAASKHETTLGAFSLHRLGVEAATSLSFQASTIVQTPHLQDGCGEFYANGSPLSLHSPDTGPDGVVTPGYLTPPYTHSLHPVSDGEEHAASIFSCGVTFPHTYQQTNQTQCPTYYRSNDKMDIDDIPLSPLVEKDDELALLDLTRLFSETNYCESLSENLRKPVY